MQRSIRGATTADKNNKIEIEKATKELLEQIIRANVLDIRKITSVIFTCTRDLDSAYPAVAARSLGLTHAALMCVQEMYVEGSLPMCIRIMINADMDRSQTKIKHVYLKDAKNLRPDLLEESIGFSIAIDGPSGAGKSTVAKLCAKELGFSYIDTGAMYRAFAFYCMQSGVVVSDTAQIDEIADTAPIKIDFVNGEQRVYANGQDISEKIRTQAVADITSKVSSLPSVRKKLVAMQRELAKKQSVIMDGRDIGTVVLSESPLKIYLDASSEMRAKRRSAELESMGQAADYAKILEEINLRDQRDMNRDESPLKKAHDALVLSCDNMSAAEVSAAICAIARIRMSGS